MKHGVAILGYGTIGSGVFKILQNQEQFEVKYIFDKKEKFNKDHLALFTDDINKILEDKAVEIVVEVLGGFDFAYGKIKQALEHKKHVVTANKEVVALKLDELTNLAKVNGVKFLFEASVGGGIPIIKTLCELGKTSKVEAIYGILNGTTNYILTRMFEGMSFDEALKKAQYLGFAEKDPTADLEGLDMVRKISILSDLSWNTFVPIECVSHKAINGLTKENIEYASKNNLTIKFICSAIKKDNKIELGVAPYYIEKTHLLASVNNEINAVFLKTNPNGDLIFIGAGAGSLPTASAVVGDMYWIIDSNKFETYKNENSFEFIGKKINNELERFSD